MTSIQVPASNGTGAGRPKAAEDTLFVVASAKSRRAAGLNLARLHTSSTAVVLHRSRGSLGEPVELGVPPDAVQGEAIDLSVRLASVIDDVDLTASAAALDLARVWHDHRPELEHLITVLLAPENLARDAEAADYQELTAAELAQRMGCTTTVFYDREKQGEFFAILAPGRVNGRRYPAFELHERLDRALLKRMIEAYRGAGVSTNQLWNFLRTKQKEFAGKTVVDILLGAPAPALDGLSTRERAEAVMDVVSEELARTAP